MHIERRRRRRRRRQRQGLDRSVSQSNTRLWQKKARAHCLEVQALRMLELVIPQYVVRGQNIRLECSFNLDGEILYSVKWYKDGNEFYRYVPRDMPPVLVFSLPGVTVDIHNSTERSVVLSSVNLMSSGRYRCEVSAEAPSFQTVSDHSDMMVVALPENGPVITGRPGRRRYQVSDVVRFNCTSAKSKPAAMLSWFINGEPVDPQYLRGPHITEVDREGLETAVLGLEFRLRTKHFKKGDMKIKCLATIATVYWKSNELSIEGERPLKMPVMESRETRAQGHTHAEHILASANIKSVGSSLSLLTLGLFILRMIVKYVNLDCVPKIFQFSRSTFLIVNYSRRICKEINPYKISYMTTDDENILYICT
ncbi:PREDICTED: uncharacterized protein LOC107070225 isoform X2 [Polistes dominula]|uniref:Uncharacterized protein LOC107070225 isoform X2 n=1 Tax=Polistes dominula TaxID=743375 RepID=A0ABM1IU18_POLDO|nr:PREDICTED: uncharacterized protein LOC107070225 isoform X2 [Polistes dominula]